MTGVLRYQSSDMVELLIERASTSVKKVSPGRRVASPRWVRQITNTPLALREALEVAIALESEVAGGDTLVVGDGGRAGVFALAERMKPESLRRHVVVVAGEATVLEHLWIAGTLDGIGDELEAVVDWEIACFRFAARVLSPSALAADLLQRFAIRPDVAVVDIAEGPPPVRVPVSADCVWLPETPSRRSQTAKILRALVDVPEVGSIVVTPGAEPDRIWEGSALDAASSSVESLGERIEVRKEPRRPPSLVILGDPFGLPDERVARLRRRGIPIAVPAGSASASLWPEAYTWTSEDSIAGVLRGEATRHGAERGVPVLSAMLSTSENSDGARAQAVSVGVPIHRDVRFLRECMESIVSQSQLPSEVVLIDDGSHSEEVDRALSEWDGRDVPPIRVLRQENRGVCVARNSLLDAMTGDSFVLVDSDDVLARNFIEKTVQAMRANPEIDAIATWTEFFGDYGGIEAKPPFDARVGRRENPIISTCVLVDMAVRDRGVRFAPDLAFIYCEDWDVWAQIVAHGGRFGLIPEPLVRHRVHATSGAHRRTDAAHRIGAARATARLWAVGSNDQMSPQSAGGPQNHPGDRGQSLL